MHSGAGCYSAVKVESVCEPTNWTCGIRYWLTVSVCMVH